MVQLKCQRCGKEWNYTGNGTWFTSCPGCKTSVKIKRTAEQTAAIKKAIGTALDKEAAK